MFQIRGAFCSALLLFLAWAPSVPAQEGQANAALQDRTREWQRAPVHSLKLDGAPVFGPVDAPIQIVEYADFLCSTCRQLADAWKSYLPNTGGKIAVYIKNYPLDRTCNASSQESPHPGSCWLALGEICASEQQAASVYQAVVFAAELAEPELRDVLDLAGQVGLEVASMESCMRSARTRATLQAQIAEATAVGVKGTPTLFMNGKRVPNLNDVAAWVLLETQSLSQAAGKQP